MWWHSIRGNSQVSRVLSTGDWDSKWGNAKQVRFTQPVNLIVCFKHCDGCTNTLCVIKADGGVAVEEPVIFYNNGLRECLSCGWALYDPPHLPFQRPAKWSMPAFMHTGEKWARRCHVRCRFPGAAGKGVKSNEKLYRRMYWEGPVRGVYSANKD